MNLAAPPLTVSELERRLRAVNAGVILLPPRRLRRVIKEDRDIGGLGLQVPHRLSYTISRERLLRWLPREELGPAPDARLPATLLLLVRPDAVELENQAPDQVLRRYWRLLFHARVHAVLDRRMAEGELTAATISERLHALGPAVVSEIRLVLEQENLLLPPADEATLFGEFAAVYLELRFFAPDSLAAYFPSLEMVSEVDHWLASDVDAEALLAETRPAGAADALIPATNSEGELPASSAIAPAEQPFTGIAERAASLGNVVRAARLHQRAGDESAARVDLDRLAERLRAALGLDDTAMSQWRAAIEPLLKPGSVELWPIEARLLYDLQKVCLDRERAVYAVDVVEWAYSLGRRPIKRLLPGQTDVLQLKHLRMAARRVTATRIAGKDRERLETLLHEAVENAEMTVRATFRPRVAEVLHDVGLRPTNLPERVALNKLTEELLDRVVERGYLNMGNLRDAVSRNNLRLPDLSGPREFFRGDKLIRANRRLPVLLDGVYRRGEFYLRWLQRLSSLAFGTVIGRIFVLYLMLPFGGAFLTLEGLQHIIHLAVKLLVPADIEEPRHIHLATPAATAILGGFLFGLIHSTTFRGWIVRALLAAGEGLRLLAVELPAILLRLPVVRRLLSSRPVVLFGQYLARPAVVGWVVGLMCAMVLTRRESIVAGAAAFLAGCLFFNSRLAGELEETLLDGLAGLWLRLRIELVPALFHFIIAVFKRVVEAVDCLLYTVDEWLRFRAGEGRWTFTWKLVLGTLWFFVSYIVRVYVNLFIEPTTNPIKHFPVVTVAAKLMAPFMLTLLHAMTAYLGQYMSHALAGSVAALHVLILPGIFGFLAWELKENWRLYRANQPKTLRPDRIGHHGETLHGLLKLGFHSGTVPKLYRKLRRATRESDDAAARKQREALHQVAEMVRHFTEREFIALLEMSRSWGGIPFRVGRVKLGCTSIRVELCGPSGEEESAWMLFEEQGRSLAAGVEQWGWLKQRSEPSRRSLALALAGWCQLADAERDSATPSLTTPIPWPWWVEAWERDQRGEPVPEPL